MIEHLRGRDRKLEPLGWTGQDAEWIALVCLHGPMGSLSSSFIPAGRLGTAPHKLVFSRGWARRWAPSGPG